MFDGPFSDVECLAEPTFGDGVAITKWTIEAGSGWALHPPGMKHISAGAGALAPCISPCLYQKSSDMAVPLVAGARYRLHMITTHDNEEVGGTPDIRVHLVDVSDLENNVVRRSHVVIAEGVVNDTVVLPDGHTYYYEFYFSVPHAEPLHYFNGATWDAGEWAIALYGNVGGINSFLLVQEIGIRRDTSDYIPVAITSDAPDPTTESPIQCRVTFGTWMLGFAVGDIVVTGGTISNFAADPEADPGAEYTFDLTPDAGDFVTVKVNIADSVALSNGDSIPNSAAPEFSRTFFKGVPVRITSASLDPTATKPIPCTVTFDDPVTGFESGDIVVTNGTVSGFAGSGAVYTFNLVPSAGDPIVVKANIAAGVAVNAGGTVNAAAPEFSRTYYTASTTGPITFVLEDLSRITDAET